MTERNLAVYTDDNPTRICPRYPYLHAINSRVFSISGGQVGEEKGGYGSPRDGGASFPAELRAVRVEALRHVADAQIRSLLKLACLLDAPDERNRSKDELKGFADSIRAATTNLEDTLHPLADIAAGKEPEV